MIKQSHCPKCKGSRITWLSQHFDVTEPCKYCDGTGTIPIIDTWRPADLAQK